LEEVIDKGVAMAAGLPVITTKNCGSVVRNGLDGFIIPVIDTEAIREKISYLFENPEIAKTMSMNALEKIKQYSWQRYREEIINIYSNLLP
jgi:glycosyltransferase involved in cell wall biosynthesis